MIKLNVKWNKETFNNLDVDLEQPPLVFKTQLYTLTGVPPERQKIMAKGAMLKDDDWGKTPPKEGQTLMMMGTADAIVTEVPKNVPQFVEDLPEKEQAALANKQYGSGLHNLGNTCYMNSTLQCLYSIPHLKQKLFSYQPAVVDPQDKLVVAARDLFQDLDKGNELPPYKFLFALRELFPQFAQQTNEGIYMQQDAEECFSQLFYTLRQKLKDDAGESFVDKQFGLRFHTKLTCEESSEEFEETTTGYMLKCNISSEVNFLSQGIKLGLKEDREKNSAALGRLALFKGGSTLASLPQSMVVQMVRFFYKADVQQKAKILRKVTYPLELDVYEFCSEELQKSLEPARVLAKELEDKAIEDRKKVKLAGKPTGKPEDTNGASTSATAMEVDTPPAALLPTGKYQLTGVLTHKGRSADSGHYVAWIKQKDNTWMLFDDEKLIPKTEEDVLALSGGGDWHMAYLLLYEAKTVAQPKQE